MCAQTYTARQIFAVVCGVLVISFLVAVSFLVPVNSSLTALAAKLQAFGVGGAVLFGLIYIVGAMALVPPSAFSLAAGLIYGFWGIVLAWVAMMMVAATSFPLARHLLSRRASAFVQHRRLLRIVMEVINEEGWRMVLLVRVSGIVPSAFRTIRSA